MISECPMGIVATDAELRVTGWNRWMETMTGRTSEEVLGKPLQDLYPELRAARRQRFYELALGGQEVVLAQRFHRYLLPIWTLERWMEQSARISPVIEHDVVVGTLTFIEDVTERVERELELRQKIEDLEQAQQKLQLQEREIRRALDYERTLLQMLAESFNGKAPELPGLEIACRYQAAYESERFGGDYFDFIDFGENRLGLVMADVCGKGLKAGVFTAMAKYTVRAFSFPEQPPEFIVPRVNELMFRQIGEEGMFITMAFVTLDLGKMTAQYVNAGHCSPLLHRPSTGESHLLGPTGPPLGVFARPPYRQQEIALESGDVLVLVTDGIIDAARDASELLLGDILAATGACSDVNVLADAIIADAMERAKDYQLDDIALIVIRIP